MDSLRVLDWSTVASMVMEVTKPPLQPASQGAGGSYGNGSISTQMVNAFTSENCNPNMDKEAVTPVKGTPKKTPKNSRAAGLGENGLGKSPVRRKLDCDGGAHESGALGKSPAKASLPKETGASPHKHFCRSPRCAANNPEYAVPAPRQYLKSKRHLLAGWQPPLNSKLKTPVSAMRDENPGHGCNSDNHEGLEGEPIESHIEGDVLSTKLAAETVVCENVRDHTPAGASNDESHLLDSDCAAQEVPHIDALNLVDLHHGEEAVADYEGKTEAPPLQPVVSISNSKDSDAIMRGMSASNSSVDLSLENSENAEVVLSAETASTSNHIGEELPLRFMYREISALRADPVRASKNTNSDFSMRSIGEDGSDSRRLTCGSSRPPRRRYKRGGRRLSIGTANRQSVALQKQEGLKRKQAEEWMWDTAIKDAVQRFSPQVPGSVNVLVKAFESVKLTEEEIQRAKYKNTAVGRLVLKDSPFESGFGAIEADVSPMETIVSINKVQAWDESLASADFVNEMNADKPRQDESMASTPKKLQSNMPQYIRYHVVTWSF